MPQSFRVRDSRGANAFFHLGGWGCLIMLMVRVFDFSLWMSSILPLGRGLCGRVRGCAVVVSVMGRLKYGHICFWGLPGWLGCGYIFGSCGLGGPWDSAQVAFVPRGLPRRFGCAVFGG